MKLVGSLKENEMKVAIIHDDAMIDIISRLYTKDNMTCAVSDYVNAVVNTSDCSPEVLKSLTDGLMHDELFLADFNELLNVNCISYIYDVVETGSNYFTIYYTNRNSTTIYLESRDVESSQIKSMAYHNEMGILKVTFKNDTEYLYIGVNEDTFNNLMSADSIGSYFNKNIKSELSIVCVKL